jgi:hypothetical protein
MKPTLILATVTTIAMGLPASLYAAPASAAYDRCVKAFVLTLPEKIGAAPRLRESRFIGSDHRGDTPAEYAMTATNPKTNQAVWKAVCTVDSHGEVVAMRDAR